MKLLVLSDSHMHMEFMRRCVEVCRPDAVVHLGDYYVDGDALAQELVGISFYQVPGNCDRGRIGGIEPAVRVLELGGVRFFLTHGHQQYVKQGLGRLIAEAKAFGADCALFGHTHQAVLLEEEGMMLVNPGSCGYFSSSCALIEIVDQKISACRILRQTDLEDGI